MSEFIVSARKYRPSTFDSVVGQEALTTTLKNAIQSEKLSHAYLFCGPRGVGKTSCARIFAKTINCENRTANGEACNKCDSCMAANEQRSYNITELDAASNNSVNDIRQLIEQVYIAPTSGKYRIYIIDEVHMLSSSAFNAFLKTLEEPPAHAIFILATTEKHKVLPTIVSRCQVHDFSRITSLNIAQHLQKIADIENIIADPEALQMIGIAADGGMRDALSMFDQIAGFGQGKITVDGVRQNLNLLDEHEYFSILGYIIKGLHSEVLSLIDQLLKKGYDGNIIMHGFSTFLRNILLSQSETTVDIIEVPSSIKSRMIKAGQVTKPFLLWEFLKISTTYSTQYKNSSDKRLMLEISLLKMCEMVSNSLLRAPETGSTATDTKQSKEIDYQDNNQKQINKAVEGEVQTVMKGQSIDNKKPSTPMRDPAQKVASNPRDTGQSQAQDKKIPGRSNKQKYAFDLMTGKRATNEEADTYEKPSNKRAEHFTQEQLHKAWREYAYGKNPIICKLLDRQDSPPILKDHGVIHYKVISKVEKEQVEELIPELNTYLSNKLNNDGISIIVDFVPENNINTQPITIKDKYETLAKKNPWIERMCEDLNLQL